MDEETIRQMIQEKLRSGERPRDLATYGGRIEGGQPPPTPLTGRYGRGPSDPCFACGEPIATTEYVMPDRVASDKEIVFHNRCREIYLEERSRPRRRP